MSEFKLALKPYDLKTALATDRGEDCLVLDVSHDENSQPVASFKHVVDTVEHYVAQVDGPVFLASKLYVVGEWILTPPKVNGADKLLEEEIEVCHMQDIWK